MKPHYRPKQIQTNELGEQAEIAQSQLNIAGSQEVNSARMLDASEGPNLTFQPISLGPLTVTRNGLNANLGFSVENVGHSEAIDFQSVGELLSANVKDLESDQRKFCVDVLDHPGLHIGHTIQRGEITTEATQTATLTDEKITLVVGEGEPPSAVEVRSYNVVFIGCMSYASKFSPTIKHTIFGYRVGQNFALTGQ